MNKKTNKMTRGYAAGGAVGNDLASVYQNTLGREPDAEGLAFFQQSLGAGESIDSIRGLIQGSQEGQAYVKTQAATTPQVTTPTVDLNSIYQDTLGRTPDSEGLAFFQQQLDSGQSFESIRGLIQGSQEGQAYIAAQAGATEQDTTTQTTDTTDTAQTTETDNQAANEAKLEELYQLTLGRQADADGLAFFLEELKSGQTAESIAGKLQSSQEGQAYLKTGAGLAAQTMASSALTNPADLVTKAEVQDIATDPNQVVTAPVTPSQQAVPQADATLTNAASSTVQAEELAKAESSAFTPAKTVEADLTEAKANAIMDGTVAATAQVSDKATVRGQLAMLMDDFDNGETTPVWASGSMRRAMQVMQSRGMGASSIAGAAVVQAAMESAMAVAVPDAQINAQFELQNLSNEQQTTIFKSQQRMASIFSDQAATNASLQFNATSENQTNQFFANMEAEVSKFNTAQVNAILQFNAEKETQVSMLNAQSANEVSMFTAAQNNAQAKFNANLRAQNDQFNAQNSLVVSQSNAVWRQNVSTADTAANNIANLEYAKNVNAVTGASIDQIWQRERDLMDFAFKSSESSMDRASAILMAKLSEKAQKAALDIQADMQADKSRGAILASLAGRLAFGI